MRRPVDWSLCLVADTSICARDRLVEMVLAAVRGGVSWVQFRDKQGTARQSVRLGQDLKEKLKAFGIPLIINDRTDIAFACEADGVHLGQEDLSIQDARRLLGDHAIIGLSVESMSQVLGADLHEADYLGVSPIFSTGTKPELTSSWQLEGLRELRRRTPKPLIAIGGIQASNARHVMESGADGVAVVSSICARPDPEKAAYDLRQAVGGVR